MASLFFQDREVRLDREMLIGRSHECGIHLPDGKASRKHARIFRGPDGEVWVEDLDSHNGTLVNGAKIDGRRRLGHDDWIGVGGHRILFHDQPAASPKPAPTPRSGHRADPEGDAKLVGMLIGGYRIHEVIAHGHLGTIYRATQLTLDRDVAFKVFTHHITEIAGFTQRFLAGARQAGEMTDEGIVQVHDCGRDDQTGALWYSMGLVEGETVQRIVEQGGKLAPALALLVVERVALALHAAHAQGAVHQELRPSKILLSDDGRIRVLDLGLAGILRSARELRANGLVDPAYASPEQAAGGAGDRRSDIYSLGCVLFFLLAGEPPFAGEDDEALIAAHRDAPVPSVRKRVAGLPAELDTLLAGMLSKNPEWRYESLAEVLRELKPLRERLQLAAPAQPPTASTRPQPDPAERAGASEARRERQAEANLQRLAFRLVTVVAVAIIAALVLPAWWHQHPGKSADDAVVPATSPPIVTRPPPVVPAPVPALASTVDPLRARWQAAQAEVASDVARGLWGSAERELSIFIDHSAGETHDSARLSLDALRLDGEAWYRAELAKLPAQEGAALARLAQVRDAALSGDRVDAESRYQAAQSRLLQRLRAAERDARQRLEANQAAQLPALADALVADFAGTPIAGVQRRFAAAARESAASAKLWRGTWGKTGDALKTAKGADALAAGAALLLHGDIVDGKALLLAEPALAQGDLLRRREAVLGREAAVLSFTEVSDLQFIETLAGDIVFVSGGLTGRVGEGAGLACTVPVGGATWEVALTLDLREADAKDDGSWVEGGQAVVSCVHGSEASLTARIESAGAVIKVRAGELMLEQQAKRPKTTTPLCLRLACRDRRLQIVMNGDTVFACANANVPVGSQLRIEVSGLSWKLSELQVVVGE